MGLHRRRGPVVGALPGPATVVLAVVLAAVAVAAGLLPAGTAAASCAGPFRVVAADADVLLVGTVRVVGDGRATLTVRQVWRGPALAPQVEVETSPAGGGAVATSVDAHLESGVTYLVAASRDLETNDCLVTRYRGGSHLAALRPDEVRRPTGDGVGAPEGSAPWLPAGAAAGLLLAAGAGLVWHRRRTTPPA